MRSIQHEQKDPVWVEKSGDNIYFNATISNRNPDKLPINAFFHEIRDTPLFEGPPTDYTMSVIRFTIPTELVPIQLFPVKPTSINESINSISLEWNGFVEQKFLQWEPQDKTARVPTAAGHYNDFLEYYSLYSFDYFMLLINQAFALATAALIADGAPAMNPPFFYYDANTKLISLYAPPECLPTKPIPVHIYLNGALNANFNNTFPNFLHGYLHPQGLDTQLLVGDKRVNKVTLSGNDYYVMTQEFISLSLMLSFTSIVITSASLPVRNEWTAIGQGNNNNFLGIVTDFQMSLNTGLETKNSIYYVPISEYRRATLTSTLPIQTIDLNFYWRTNFGTLIPIRIPAAGEATVKLIFERK